MGSWRGWSPIIPGGDSGVEGESMWKKRETMEAEERAVLAPFAVCSADSLGREIAEEPHAYRTHFQRDRARVIHSSAFRRLDGKTQVFLNGTGDHFRTRLTHTMEVASISRTLARALSLNEDLAETVALAHDLGHPPFGHVGEEALDDLMEGHGGFDHNEQSLRMVSGLEEKYPDFPGLNLSYEVLEGLRKHERRFESPGGREYRHPCIEGQVADLADEITYYSHDLDDGLESGLLRPEMLGGIALWAEAIAQAKREMAGLEPVRDRGYVIRCLINREVDDAVMESAGRIAEGGVKSVWDARDCEGSLAGFSREIHEKNAELKRFLFANLYRHPEVRGVHERNCELLRKAFFHYIQQPEKMGNLFFALVGKNGKERAVCDFLASKTDRALLRWHPGD